MQKLGACFCLGLLSPAAFADNGLGLELNSFTHSEPVSVHGVLDEMSGEFSGGDSAETHNRLELHYSADDWQYGLFSRYDYELSFHPDTGELLYLSQDDRELPSDKRYQLALRGQHILAEGVSLARSFRYADLPLELTIKANLLRARHLQDAEIHGHLELASGRAPRGRAEIDYRYDEDRLFHRPDLDTPSGWGYALDLRLDWQASADLKLSLQADDLVHQVRWRDAPYTRASLDLSASRLDNEQLIVAPALTGQEGEASAHMRLKTRIDLSADYALNERWHAAARYQSKTTNDYYWLETSYELDWGGTVGLAWEAENQALGFQWQGEHFGLHVFSDSSDVQKAHILGLSLNVQARF